MKKKFDMAIQQGAFIVGLFYEAWKASPVRGMGVMQQDKGNQSLDAVMTNIYTKGDYPSSTGAGRSANSLVLMLPNGSLKCDYVFGRMVKLHVRWNAQEGVCLPETDPNPDYQGWATRYKTYAELAEAAEAFSRAQLPEELLTKMRAACPSDIDCYLAHALLSVISDSDRQRKTSTLLMLQYEYEHPEMQEPIMRNTLASLG